MLSALFVAGFGNRLVFSTPYVHVSKGERESTLRVSSIIMFMQLIAAVCSRHTPTILGGFSFDPHASVVIPSFASFPCFCHSGRV